MIISLTPAMSFAAEDTLTDAQKEAILAQRRDIAESHMRKITSIIWRSETDLVTTVSNDVLPEKSSEYFYLEAGRLYQGLPYSFSGGSYGSWEELITGVDDNGVFVINDLNWQQVSGTGDVGRFGTDCSGAVTQAWSQFGSSAKPQSTRNMTPKYGYLHVGEYTTGDDTMDDAEITANGDQVMYRAYAQLQKADALVHNGHVRMVVSVDVVYNEDGTINGKESTVTYLEQSRQHMREDRYHYDETYGENVWELCGVDLKLTFQSLFNYSYRPITCLELIDATAGPKTPAVTDSLSSANYGFDTLFSGTLTTSNWLIDTVQMTITDQSGDIVQQGMVIAPRSGKATRFKVPMSLFVTDTPNQMLGYIAPDVLVAGQYHCEVVCRLTTGQTFTVRDFDFDVTTTKNDIHKVAMDFTKSTIYDCPMCGTKAAQWQPLTTDYVGSGNGPKTGHYYLPESMPDNASYISTSGQTVCLHLNGKNINSRAQALSVSTSDNVGGVLNVMGDGIVSGTKPSTSYFGAAIQVSGGTVNLYGGTYRHNKNTDATDTTQRPVIGIRKDSQINMYDGAKIEGDPNVKRPNVLIYSGRFNMYGGEVVNGYGTNGGNFLVGYDSGYYLNYLCIYGGKITNGLATGMGGNIYAVHDSYVYIYGGEVSGGEAAKGGNLAINAGGNMRISGGSVTNGTATSLGNGIYGTNTTTKITSKTQIDEATGELKVSELYLKDGGVVIGAAAQYEGETYTENNAYVRFEEKAETDITLQQDMDRLFMTHDLNVDLNGFDILDLNTNGYTLTVWDSATDDYDVSDGIYGTIPADADIQIPEGYIPVTVDGKTSFHKYDIQQTELVVNTKKVGLTYKAQFLGDAVIKDGIREFGVAVRAYHAPNANTILLDTNGLTHMALSPDNWQNRKNVKSVYVVDVMDANETAAMNNARAQVPVYGIGYIKLNDGTILFSDAHCESLQSAMQYMDSLWNSAYLDDADRTELTNFCSTWRDVMLDWTDLDNIKNAIGISTAEIQLP